MHEERKRDSRRGRARGFAVLILAVIGVLVLGGRWFLGLLSDPAPTEVAESSRDRSGVDGEALDPGESIESADASRVVVPEAEEVSPTERDSDPLDLEGGSGTLEVLVVDEASGEPLPDHEFRLFKERDGYRVLAEGRTDERGRARFPKLAENLYAVETLRAPPHAPGVGAVWLGEGATAEILVRVGSGGSLTGRVVDDLGEPLEGARLGLSSWGLGLRRGIARDEVEKDTVTITDEEGRFRIDHVLSAPTGLWWVDDELRVERWEGVRVYAYFGDGKDWSEQHIHADELVEVPDLVVPRAGTWHGIVVDEAGTPIPGALVSPRNGRWVAMSPSYGLVGEEWERWRGFPGDEGFALQGPEEVLTDEAGRFEFSTRRTDHQRLSVLTPDRRIQQFMWGKEIPRVAPGERSEELILQVETELRWTLRFLDERGQPLDVRSSFGTQGRPWPMGNWPANWQSSRANLLLDDQRKHSVNLEVDVDTGTEAVLPLRLDPRRVRGVRVQVVGFTASDVMFQGAASAEETLDVTLTPWGVVPIRFEDGDGILGEDDSIRLHASLTRILPSVEAPFANAGLGSYAPVKLGAEGVDVDLVAQAPGEYWVVLQVPFGVDLLRSYGPFRPGSQRVTVELDREFVEALLPDPPPDTEAVVESPPPPPPPSVAPKTRVLGQLRVRAVDAKTGEGLTNFSVGFGRDRESGEHGSSWWSVNSGSLAAETDVGVIWFRVHAMNYSPSELLSVELVEGGVADMGAVPLVPLPRYAGRLLDDDRRPVGVGQLRIMDAEREFSATPPLSADGTFEILGEVGREITLQAEVDAPLEHYPGEGFQQLEVRRWSVHEEKTLILAPWRPLEIVVQGLDPNLSGASLTVHADWLDAEPRADPGVLGSLGYIGDSGASGEGGTIPPSTQATEFAWSPDADRHFGVVAGPGRVRIRVDSPLREFEPIEVQVTGGAEVQRIEIAPR